MVAIGWRTAVRDPYLLLIGVGVSLLGVLIYSVWRYRTTTHILQALSITLLTWILTALALIIYQRRYEQGEPLPS
jgi:hypothetical protein